MGAMGNLGWSLILSCAVIHYRQHDLCFQAVQTVLCSKAEARADKSGFSDLQAEDRFARKAWKLGLVQIAVAALYTSS